MTQQTQSGLTMQSRHSVETYLSSLSHCGLILAIKKSNKLRMELISTFKKKKKAQTSNESSKPSLQILASEGKAYTTLYPKKS